MFYSKIICVLIVIVVMNMWIKDGSFIARKHLFRLPPMQCMHSDYAVCSDLAELLGKKKSLSNTSLNVRKNIMTYSVLGVPDLQKQVIPKELKKLSVIKIYKIPQKVCLPTSVLMLRLRMSAVFLFITYILSI